MMVLAGVLTIEYTAPPLSLSYKGMGELVIIFLFGILLVTGSYYLFANTFTLQSLVLSFPAALLIGAVIICNEVPDVDADIKAGKKTLIYFFGKEKAFLLYGAVIALSYVSVLLNVKMGIINTYFAGLAVFYIAGIIAMRLISKKYENIKDLVKASALTVMLHALVGSGIIIGVLMA
jgi:1,4-dihydroxy-2-naphthoate octaprenyltransferase